jgi:hypothetical protein
MLGWGGSGPDLSRPIGINLSNGCVLRERNTDSEGFLLPMKGENRRETAAVNMGRVQIYRDRLPRIADTFIGN